MEDAFAALGVLFFLVLRRRNLLVLGVLVAVTSVLFTFYEEIPTPLGLLGSLWHLAWYIVLFRAQAADGRWRRTTVRYGWLIFLSLLGVIPATIAFGLLGAELFSLGTLAGLPSIVFLGVWAACSAADLREGAAEGGQRDG
ncbi:hypothetical protein [Nonomuraea sp. NPDC050310]|uniref:hypothetical protein n=1 Tax=Nonomuraea sp. NPDC050310 TaxID=3154935 RepID=UPI0033E5E4E2